MNEELVRKNKQKKTTLHNQLDPIPLLKARHQTVDELLKALDSQDKISLRDGDLPFWKGLSRMLKLGNGAGPWSAGSLPEHGIPGIKWLEGAKGIVLRGATTFPVPIARAATFDRNLEERIGDVIGYELRALGGTVFGGVCLNLMRHPSWGKAQESYGEDPVLAGTMGTALVQGVQRHAMACLKHFCLSSKENTRFESDIIISKRALHELFLPQFRKAIGAGAAAVMTGYNAVNGIPTSQNYELLTGILRKRWHFSGIILSDFMFAINDPSAALEAGIDIEMPFQMHLRSELQRQTKGKKLYRDNHLQSCKRILQQQFTFLKQGNYERKYVGGAKARLLALEAAEKSMVLLQNEESALPLLSIRSLAVVGPLVRSDNLGDTRSSATSPTSVTNPISGLKRILPSSVTIRQSQGHHLEKSSEIAAKSDATIVIVGYNANDEGEHIPLDLAGKVKPLLPYPRTREDNETHNIFMRSYGGDSKGKYQKPAGDRKSLQLRDADIKLIETVCAVSQRVIVVIVAGSPVLISEWRHKAQAILLHWYAGMEGGLALARILKGEVSPAGKLPFALPHKSSDLQDFHGSSSKDFYDLWHGYRKLDHDKTTPAYPFGFGLSYSSFQFSELEIRHEGQGGSETVIAHFLITNTGSYDSDVVAQLYVSVPRSKVSRPPVELKGFERIHLKSGEFRYIDIPVPINSLAYFCEDADNFTLEPTTYDIYVGHHAHDANALVTRFALNMEHSQINLDKIADE
ncbi:beta-glucosidase [Flexibacterium corallicola]|uniref:beta-glucosidase n=1 Tax=Flexibacterium corallicola TaxID=3037259 RepID=UPI00286F16D8|nr:glycoside hydrolase family 3 C-terminal domain-containing protein [Pseudovibrio sp. M1P-2-3]